ncbi:MAG: hypothetical protein QOF89_5054 [Acidobacteriota bacterium]|jgi:hypothetical protein|nr:hypothetical protein [Acidobacteriota bacterium]
MEDFVLTLQPLAEGHLVQAECPLVGQVTGSISLRDRQELEALGARLQTNPLREIPQVVEVGQQLFRNLFGTKIATHFRTAQQEARDDGGLRVLLRFSKDDRLQDLPWELLHDGSWPLALNPATPIARYIEMSEPVRRLLPRGQLRVLFTAASPPGTQELDLGTEERKIREYLRSLANVDLEIDNQITLRRLERLLTFAENAGRPFHIWHHAGHGFRDKHSKFFLCLEGDEQDRNVGVEKISQILATCPNLLAVVLNVCHGAALATALACEHLPVAIGFREQILDRAALLFAQKFYGSLLRHPVEVALAHSRLALAYQGCPLLNWTNPLLYTRTTRAVHFMEGRDGRPRGRV